MQESPFSVFQYSGQLPRQTAPNTAGVRRDLLNTVVQEVLPDVGVKGAAVPATGTEKTVACKIRHY